jgi:hypothetical protein
MDCSLLCHHRDAAIASPSLCWHTWHSNDDFSVGARLCSSCWGRRKKCSGAIYIAGPGDTFLLGTAEVGMMACLLRSRLQR